MPTMSSPTDSTPTELAWPKACTMPRSEPALWPRTLALERPLASSCETEAPTRATELGLEASACSATGRAPHSPVLAAGATPVWRNGFCNAACRCASTSRLHSGQLEVTPLCVIQPRMHFAWKMWRHGSALSGSSSFMSQRQMAHASSSRPSAFTSTKQLLSACSTCSPLTRLALAIDAWTAPRRAARMQWMRKQKQAEMAQSSSVAVSSTRSSQTDATGGVDESVPELPELRCSPQKEQVMVSE
mmetsp:Transcript_29950/g.63141  ORF Transcript_29950/g.63141 Transcript_29950/m.63141 type:complete len:245 (+) Transcript_29950:43-777(+)